MAVGTKAKVGDTREIPEDEVDIRADNEDILGTDTRDHCYNFYRYPTECYIHEYDGKDANESVDGDDSDDSDDDSVAEDDNDDEKFAIVKAEGLIIEGPYECMTGKYTIVEMIDKHKIIKQRPDFIERIDGTKEWYKNGKHHRDDDQPAVIRCPGKKWNETEWYKNGIRHRDGDQPAYISSTTKEWYKNGVLHRDDDKPAIVTNEAHNQCRWDEHGNTTVTATGCDEQSWYKNGKLHREGDQPAIISKFKQVWYKNGVLHRDGDQPALIEVRIINGKKNNCMDWYEDGKLIKSSKELCAAAKPAASE
jgi:hypothetical protein